MREAERSEGAEEAINIYLNALNLHKPWSKTKPSYSAVCPLNLLTMNFLPFVNAYCTDAHTIF